MRAVAHRRLRGDSGNALVEFVYLAVLLMVPLVYVLLTVFKVQAAAYAVSSAAREAGRVYASSDSLSDARGRAYIAAVIVMRDSGLELEGRDLRIGCPARCLAPGGQVRVTIAYDVSLPLLPHVFDGRAPATVRVTGQHVELVDRYREAPQ